MNAENDDNSRHKRLSPSSEKSPHNNFIRPKKQMWPLEVIELIIQYLPILKSIKILTRIHNPTSKYKHPLQSRLMCWLARKGHFKVVNWVYIKRHYDLNPIMHHFNVIFDIYADRGDCVLNTNQDTRLNGIKFKLAQIRLIMWLSVRSKLLYNTNS